MHGFWDSDCPISFAHKHNTWVMPRCWSVYVDRAARAPPIYMWSVIWEGRSVLAASEISDILSRRCSRRTWKQEFICSVATIDSLLPGRLGRIGSPSTHKHQQQHYYLSLQRSLCWNCCHGTILQHQSWACHSIVLFLCLTHCLPADIVLHEYNRAMVHLTISITTQSSLTI